MSTTGKHGGLASDHTHFNREKLQHHHGNEQGIAYKQGAVHYPFWFGGSASCFAATVTHPLDLVKVRLQTRAPDGPKGMFNTFLHILRHDGFRGLYSGLSASLLRQLTYSTTRFGVYETVKPQILPTDQNISNGQQQPSLPTLLALASVSGFLGGLAGNPADVIMVRMQSDLALPAQQRRNYSNAIHGLLRMTREEGWGSLWKGVEPNSMRAVLMTASQLASYDFFKGLLVRSSLGEKKIGKKTGVFGEDDLVTHFSASIAAGFVATTVCSPVDVIKTRVMSARKQQQGQGRAPSSIVLDVLRQAIRVEGVSWMWRGWVPSFVRLGPHTVATFVFLEQHKKAWRWLKEER